jgi:hypothetical protein
MNTLADNWQMSKQAFIYIKSHFLPGETSSEIHPLRLLAPLSGAGRLLYVLSFCSRLQLFFSENGPFVSGKHLLPFHQPHNQYPQTT